MTQPPAHGLANPYDMGVAPGAGSRVVARAVLTVAGAVGAAGLCAGVAAAEDPTADGGGSVGTGADSTTGSGALFPSAGGDSSSTAGGGSSDTDPVTSDLDLPDAGPSGAVRAGDPDGPRSAVGAAGAGTGTVPSTEPADADRSTAGADASPAAVTEESVSPVESASPSPSSSSSPAQVRPVGQVEDAQVVAAAPDVTPGDGAPDDAPGGGARDDALPGDVGAGQTSPGATGDGPPATGSTRRDGVTGPVGPSASAAGRQAAPAVGDVTPAAPPGDAAVLPAPAEPGATPGSTREGGLRSASTSDDARRLLELPDTVLLTPADDFAALAARADDRFRPTLDHLAATGGADLYELQDFRREGVTSQRDWVDALGEAGRLLRKLDMSVPTAVDPVSGGGSHTGLHCYVICKDGTAQVLADPTAVLAVDRAPFSTQAQLREARPDRVARVEVLPFGEGPRMSTEDTTHRRLLSETLNGYPENPPVDVYRANVSWDGTMVVAGPPLPYERAPGVVAVTSVGGGPLASSVSVHGRRMPTDQLPVVDDGTTTIESSEVAALRTRTAEVPDDDARLAALHHELRTAARTELAALRQALREQVGPPSPDQRRRLAELQTETARATPIVRRPATDPRRSKQSLRGDVGTGAGPEWTVLDDGTTVDLRTPEQWFAEESRSRPLPPGGGAPDQGTSSGPGQRLEGRVPGLELSTMLPDLEAEALVLGPETLRENPDLRYEVTPEQRPTVDHLVTDRGARMLDDLATMRRPVTSETEYLEFVAEACYRLRECAMSVPTPTPDDARRAYPAASPDALIGSTSGALGETEPVDPETATARRRMLEGSPLLETSTIVGLRHDGIAEVLNDGDFFVGHPARTGLGIDDRLFETDLSPYKKIDLGHFHPALDHSTSTLSKEDMMMADSMARGIARVAPGVEFGYCSIDAICNTVTRYDTSRRDRPIEVFPGSPGSPVASEVEVGSRVLRVPDQVVVPLPDTFVEPDGTDDRIRLITTPAAPGEDLLAAVDRGEFALAEPVRLVNGSVDQVDTPPVPPPSSRPVVATGPVPVGTGSTVRPGPSRTQAPASLPPGSGAGSRGAPRVGADGVIEVDVLSSETVGRGRSVPRSRMAPQVPNGIYYTSPGGRTVRVPTAAAGALLGAAVSPALTPLTQAIGINPVEQRPADPVRQAQAVLVDTGIGFAGGGPAGAVTTGVTSAMTRTTAGQQVTDQARRYADSGDDPGQVRRNAALGSLAGVPAQVANVTQLVGGGLQAAVETGVAAGVVGWDLLDGKLELTPQQYGEALAAMPGHTTTQQMLHRTGEQSAVNWRHTGDLITGQVEQGRAQPARQHPTCTSDADRNCIEPKSLTGFNAGVLRVGDPSSDRSHPMHGRVDGHRTVGHKIVGACVPGHAAYDSCVAAGTAGAPAYGQGVGVGYVGDGSSSPGDQLEVAAKTVSDPRALGRTVSRHVNDEIDRIRANPTHLLNYLPR